eukprot:CCRYP_019772-RA/>CCRYP_019772-RA protein AED:0.06 eAED:0.06 QI:262/1/1/1/0/0/2/1831/788
MDMSCAHFLVGRIHHVISSKSNAFADERPSNKRPRHWETGNTDSPLRESISAANEDYRRLKGFILECEESSQNLSFHSLFGILFHLVIPLPLIKDACHAAATRKIVHISQYSLIRYRHDGRGELIFDSRESKIASYETEDRMEQINSDSAPHIIVAEVHCGGFAIQSSGVSDQADSVGTLSHKNKHELTAVPALTLDMLSTTEQSCSKSRKGSKGDSLSKKEPMNITAVVDAISPILVDDTFGQPFALMELYQPESSPMYSAVAVLRGENALCMHAAILPGQSITLMGVVSRSWKVPVTFRQSSKKSDSPDDDNGNGIFFKSLYRRTPDRVILVEEANSLHLNDETNYEVLRLPSTVESLASIQGVVDSVNFYRHDDVYGKNTQHIMHFVTVKTLTQQHTFDDNHADSIPYDYDGNKIEPQRSLATINLLKYSFAPHVFLGLQPGAIIRAVNIHCIKCSDDTEKRYVACLRSTITIERCAGDRSDCSNVPWCTPSFMPFALLPHHRISDICLDPVNSVPMSQYIEEERLRMKVKPIIRELASVTQQIRILLAHHNNVGCPNNNARCRHKKTTPGLRDPYAEFFDHAHSDVLRLENQCGSFVNKICPAFSLRADASSTHSKMPNVARLDTLRDICTQDFVQKMATFCNCQSGRSRVSSGWTSSYHYYSSKVYVWGKVKFDGTNPEFRASGGVIDNSACTIPFSVALERNESKAVGNEKEDFLGWLQVKSVLVSCLCLGRGTVQGGSESADKKDSQQSVCCLPHAFLPSASTNFKEDNTLGHVFIFTKTH